MSEWTRGRIKWLAREVRTTIDPSEVRSEEVFHYSIPSLDECGDGAVEPVDAIGSNKLLLRGGEVLVSKLNPRISRVLEASRHEIPTLASTEFIALVPGLGLDARFFRYWLQSETARQSLDGATMSVTRSQQRVRPEVLTGTWLRSPDRSHQRAIADYLDHETERIDALIAAKRRMLELLAEKRRALINRLVTAGTDSERLTDSGVSWLGKIPANWVLSKFTRSVRVAEGQVDPEVEPYASMLLVAPNHIEAGTGTLLRRETAFEQGAISGKYVCRPDDVIYSKIRPALRKATIAPETCLCSADMYPLQVRSDLVPEYLLAFLLSEPFSNWAVMESERVAMPKINRDSLADLWIPIPALEEQRRIVAQIAAGCVHLDNMRSTIAQSVALLLERRQALITEAVTDNVAVPQTA